MATKPVYEGTDEALARLIESLDARKNQLFDPTLLAMAEGFLGPTTTGGFGEALGRAAGKVRASQEEQSKRDIEDAKARMEIAQMQGQMRAQQQGYQMLGGMGGDGQPSAAPGGGQANIPVGLDRNRFLAMAQAAGMAPMDAMLQWDKYQREGTKQTEAGSWNLRSQEFTPTPSAESVPLTVYDPELLPPKEQDGRKIFQTINVPKNIAIRANQLFEQEGKQGEYRKLLAPYVYGFGGMPSAAPSAAPAAAVSAAPATPAAPTTPATPATPSAPSAAPTGGAGPARTETVEERRERERKEKIGELTETEMAKANVKETREFFDAGVASRNMQPALGRAKNIVETTPGIEAAMGVLERPTVKAQIGSLVEEAIRVGNFSVGIPAIRKILTNANVPQEVIDKVAELGQLQAMWQFDQRKGLGSGTSVSNFEQQMVNAMGPNMSDSKSTYLQKLRFMENQAEFRMKLASELRARKMQYNDFEQTDDFKKMFEDYKAKQTEVVNMNPQKPAATGAFKIREVPKGQ